MRKLVKHAVLTASVLLPVAAQAHPGLHVDDAAFGLAHAFTQADHLLALLLWVGMAGCVAYWFRPWRKESWTR